MFIQKDKKKKAAPYRVKLLLHPLGHGWTVREFTFKMSVLIMHGQCRVADAMFPQ